MCKWYDITLTYDGHTWIRRVLVVNGLIAVQTFDIHYGFEIGQSLEDQIEKYKYYHPQIKEVEI
jgi:hypothetical protein